MKSDFIKYHEKKLIVRDETFDSSPFTCLTVRTKFDTRSTFNVGRILLPIQKRHWWLGQKYLYFINCERFMQQVTNPCPLRKGNGTQNRYYHLILTINALSIWMTKFETSYLCLNWSINFWFFLKFRIYLGFLSRISTILQK